jgi:hypothetical protein
MSRSSGGKNRVCFPCRIKYAGLIDLDKLVNQTTVCSECSSELTLIPDYVEIPKKQNVKGWKLLHTKFINKESLHPKSKHTDSSMLHYKITKSKERYENQSIQISNLNESHNNIVKKLLIDLTKKYQSVRDNLDKLLDFEMSLKENIIKICKKHNPDLDISTLEFKELNYTTSLTSFIQTHYYLNIKNKK